VIEKSARIVPTWADEGPGLSKAADVEALVERAKARVAPLTSRVVGRLPVALPVELNASGESALGNLIADAQRASAGAEVALMNAGGIRTGLAAGEVTWGELFAVQPFANTLVSMDLTGAQLAQALEQQWQGSPTRFLAVSGLRYRWDPGRPPAQRVVAVTVGASPLIPGRVYRVVVNNFLASGGNGFSVFAQGKNRRVGELDLDALVSFLRARPGYVPAVEARVSSP
jgi:5'-nucleotidase